MDLAEAVDVLFLYYINQVRDGMPKDCRNAMAMRHIMEHLYASPEVAGKGSWQGRAYKDDIWEGLRKITAIKS